MIHHIKPALRNLRKHITFSLLNITGLAVGLASGILILLWVLDEFSYDRFHEHLENVHVLLQDQNSDGVTYTFEALPGPLAADLKREFPEITNVARASWGDRRLIRHGDKVFREPSMYVDPSFLELFTFPALEGDPKAALTDPGSVVITERLAKKIFGSQNPIGQPLNVNNRFDYKVAAVLKDVPLNSSLQFEALFPFTVFEKANADWITGYSDNALPTWIETAPGTDLTALNEKLYNFIQSKIPDANAHVHAWPYAKYRLEASFSNGKPNGGRIDMVRLLGILGIAIILVACINFMNLSTARSSLRAREVGVRKAIGAGRSGLIAQFLGETILLTSISLALALCIAWFCLPSFNRMTEKAIALGEVGWNFWGLLVAGSLITGLIAGSYPAFFLSRFNPVRVLKNDLSDQKKGGAGGLRKILVVAQFSFSTLLILGTIFLWQQIEHLRNRPLGFTQENLLFVPMGGGTVNQWEVFRQEVQQLPQVSGVCSVSGNMLNFGSNTTGIEWPGKTEDQDFLVTITNAGEGFAKTIGLKLLEGRDFGGKQDSFTVILNKTAVARMGLNNPVGQQIRFDTTRTIIGVVEDFVQNDPSAMAEPTVIFWEESSDHNCFIKLSNNDQWKSSMDQIGAAYKKLWPNRPFEPYFMDEQCEKRFQRAKQMGFLANIFGGMSILISCLGLFGLAAFTAERRTKEIGIRKVLGANVLGITGLLAKDFLKLVLLAIVIALPIGLFGAQKALSKIDYRIDISPWVFVATAGISILVSILTVSVQSIKAALINPVKSLKSE
ncbi:MAG TPA: ABC transporter permease [Saprospiraceae bacterium]|nr:ABC transporter permease [Saprospiraceae bacterium]